MQKHKAVELITDASCGELSASRLCLLVMVLVYLPVLFVLEALGVKITYWTQFAAILGSVTGCYAVNSGVRVWKEGRLPCNQPADKPQGE